MVELANKLTCTIHLLFFDGCLFSTYHVRGTAPDAKNTVVNKTNQVPVLIELTPFSHHTPLIFASYMIASHLYITADSRVFNLIIATYSHLASFSHYPSWT